jgi:foldase protein PrsA
MLTFLRKKTKTIMIVVAVVFVGSMFYGISATRGGQESGSGRSGVIAKVNGRAIDEMRFREIMGRLSRQFGENLQPQDLAYLQGVALNQTIDFTLILDQAQRKVRISNQEVNMAIDNIMKQQNIPSKQAFQQALKQAGMSENMIQKLIKDEMLVQKMVTKVREDAKVEPADLKEVRASHILVSKESEAKNILARLNKGEDFAMLAKQYSQDPGSAVKGGDLGYFTTGQMVEPFEKTAFSLKVGETSGIVKTSFGYHIIRVADFRLRKFPGKEADVQNAALREKQEKTFQKWFMGLRSSAKVEVLSPVMRGHELRMQGKAWEAIQEYKKGAQQDPANPFVHVFLGDTYNSVGKTDLALVEYEDAVRLAGSNPVFYLMLAKVYEKAGKRELATEQYEKASLVAGDSKPMHEALLKEFQKLKLSGMVAKERAAIKRIEEKEKFEKGL